MVGFVQLLEPTIHNHLRTAHGERGVGIIGYWDHSSRPSHVAINRLHEWHEHEHSINRSLRHPAKSLMPLHDA